MRQISDYKRTRLNGIEELEKDFFSITGLEKMSPNFRLVVRHYFKEMAHEILKGEVVDLGPLTLSIRITPRNTGKLRVNFNETKKLKERLREKYGDTREPRKITVDHSNGKRTRWSNGGYKYTVYYTDDTYLLLQAKYKQHIMQDIIYYHPKPSSKFWDKVDRENALRYKHVNT